MYINFNLYDEGRITHEERLRDAEHARLANQVRHIRGDGFMSRLEDYYKQYRSGTDK